MRNVCRDPETGRRKGPRGMKDSRGDAAEVNSQ